MTCVWVNWKLKKHKKFFKKTALKWNSIIPNSKFPYGTITNLFLLPFGLLWTQNCLILSLKFNFELTFLMKKIFIWTKSPLKVNKIMPNITCSRKALTLDNSSKKKEIKTIFGILNSTLDELVNENTHISLQWKYRSAKIDGTKKTHLSI